MSELRQLPNGWKWKKLKSIAEPPQYGWTTSAEEEGDYKLLRTTDITSGRLKWETVPFCEEAPDQPAKYQLEENDIVISRAGSVGYSHLVKQPPDNAVFASYLIRFKPLLDHPKYIAYFLKSPEYWHAISDQKAGVAVQNVNATKLKEIDVPIAPLSEQKRIVAKIEKLSSSLDAGVADLKKAQKQLQRYRQSVLQAAVEGRLTKGWRQERSHLETADKLISNAKEEKNRLYEEGEIRKPKKLPSIDSDEKPSGLPEGWEWTHLSVVCNLENGDRGKNYPKRSQMVESGIPFINAGHLENGRVDLSDMNYITETRFDLLSRGKVKEGDVLFCLRGSLGKHALVDGIEKGAIASSLVIVRPLLQFRSGYLLAYFGSSFCRQMINKYDNGTAQPNLGSTNLAKFLIPLPPLEEQSEIVNEVERLLSVADEAMQTVERETKRAERLRQSILKQAFSGKLVDQSDSAGPNNGSSPALASAEGEQIEMAL